MNKVAHQNLLLIQSRRTHEWGVYGVWGRECPKLSFFGDPGVRTPLGRRRLKWEENNKIFFRKWCLLIWTDSSWLSIRTLGGQL